MRKILLLSSLLVMIMFLVSCAPQMTDEELEAELAKLTPEEREALLADLESKESGAFAGQAIAKKYTMVSPKVARMSNEKVKLALEKVKEKEMFNLGSCTDSDGLNYNVKGVVIDSNYPSPRNDACGLSQWEGYVAEVYCCNNPDLPSNYDSCDKVNMNPPSSQPKDYKNFTVRSGSNYSACQYGCSNGACIQN